MNVSMYWVISVAILNVFGRVEKAEAAHNSRTTSGGDNLEGRHLTGIASGFVLSVSDVCVTTARDEETGVIGATWTDAKNYEDNGERKRELNQLRTAQLNPLRSFLLGERCKEDGKCFWSHLPTLLSTIKLRCPHGVVTTRGHRWNIESFSVRSVLAGDREFDDNVCMAGLFYDDTIRGVYVRYYDQADGYLTNHRNAGLIMKKQWYKWAILGERFPQWLGWHNDKDCPSRDIHFKTFDYSMRKDTAPKVCNSMRVVGRGEGTYVKEAAGFVWTKSEGNFIIATWAHVDRGSESRAYMFFVIQNGAGSATHHGIVWTPGVAWPSAAPCVREESPIIWKRNDLQPSRVFRVPE